MLRKHKNIKHMKMCVTKLDKKIGPPIISIGNGWEEFKKINELKVGDHVVFILIVASTFNVYDVDNIKNYKTCK
jgi:hypothetical protein